ncbi:hypothetical protein AYJ59_09955 [Thiomicrospira sp. S5]|nr:hypothetical protein AYJ59_09955 [Thiomicrospira sp. S5]
MFILSLPYNTHSGEEPIFKVCIYDNNLTVISLFLFRKNTETNSIDTKLPRLKHCHILPGILIRKNTIHKCLF